MRKEEAAVNQRVLPLMRVIESGLFLLLTRPKDYSCNEEDDDEVQSTQNSFTEVSILFESSFICHMKPGNR